MSTGYTYEAMDRVKEAIPKTFDGDENKYKDVFAISYKRWEDQFHQPLHLSILGPRNNKSLV